MKKLLLALVLIGFIHTARTQHPYWQQQVSYQLQAHLNDTAHTLDGSARIQYTNNAPDTLHFLWMHLWANAFKNDRTAYSDQLLENGDTRFYFSDAAQKGYINQLDFRINDEHIPVEDHPEHQDIVKLLLPKPLAPGQSILITTPFHVQLPFNFGEGGHTGQSYEITQWFPQPAVYDAAGWHIMPFLSQGRGYTQVASFDVTLSLPSNYVVVAPGLLNEGEKNWLQQRSDFDFTPSTQRIRTKQGRYKTVRRLQPASAKEYKTIRFLLKEGFGFSWIADKRLRVVRDTVALSSGIVDLRYYYLPASNTEGVDDVKKVIQYYDSTIIHYPFQDIAVVQLYRNNTHPGFIQVKHKKQIPDMLSRMWFEQSMPGNARQYPWMSNGPAWYYYSGYQQNRTGRKANTIGKIALATAIATRNDQPIDLPATEYTATNYELSTRIKAAEWLQLLRSRSGEPSFTEIMKVYSNQWRFRNAYPAALQQISDSIKRSADAPFDLLSATGPLSPSFKKRIGLAFLGKVDTAGKYHYISIAPALGYNRYDNLMLGAIVHNYQLPPSRLKFVLAPLFGVGSNKINGIGRVSYTGYLQHFLRSWEAGTDFATFTYNHLTNLEGNTTRLGFTKLAPWLQLNLNPKNPRSTYESFFRLKYFFITEDNFSFKFDSTTQRMEVGAIASSRSFGQLKFVSANHRALYPYRLEFQFEGASHFGRLALTGNYFLNYSKGGGLDIRAFAGKFFYFGSRDYAASRYYLNMTGPNGQEDYAYANYFPGRSAFQGWMSQQVMMRDGGFKVRTDLLGNKIGRTDSWLAALNVNSTLHPKLPVKIFADLGTYGEAWAKESDQPRLLFDAGLQLSLLKNTINVYVPLLYSNVYRDYFRLYTNFWQRLSFSIDMQAINFKKMQQPFHRYGF